MSESKGDIEFQRAISSIPFEEEKKDEESVIFEEDTSQKFEKSPTPKPVGFMKEAFKPKFLAVTASLIFNFLLYLVTLRGCSSDAHMTCVAEIVPLIPTFCFYIFVITLVIDGVLLFSLKSVIPKLYGYIAFLEILIIVIISNGYTFQSHGGYNKLIFIVSLFLNFITIKIFRAIYKIIKKHPKLAISIIIIIGVSLYLLIFVYLFRNSCKDWKKAMKNTKISKENCKFPKPKMCFYDLTSNWFDLSSHLNRNDCSKVKNNIPILQEPADFIAYPKTQYFSRDEKNFEVYQKTILERMKKINESQIMDEKLEVVLDQRNDEKKILINVFRNESLIERSQSIWNNPDSSKPIAQNILIVYIDSVSRQHFSRKLSKTLKWIENYYENKTSSLESFQFLKYHASGSYTDPNMMKIFYGTDYDHANKSYPLPLKFKKQGYITAKSSNLCASTFFDVLSTEPKLKDLDMETYDLENIALFCDPNYQKMDVGLFDYNEGFSSIFRRCLYYQDTYNYALDYGNKFWRAYYDMPKVLELGFIDAHEPTHEVLQYLDVPLYNFLTELESENLLNDTAIVFYADHGPHPNVFYYLFKLKDVQYELRLPMLYMVLPRKLTDKYGDNLKHYQNNLVAAYDIYNSFSFLGGDSHFHINGVNLFQENEKVRHCSDMDLEKSFCLCKCEK